MKIVEVSNLSIKRKCKQKDIASIILKFHESNAEASEILFDENDYKSTASAYSSFYKSIKRMHINVSIIQDQGRLYLIKKQNQV